jgi:hypothetical protein
MALITGLLNKRLISLTNISEQCHQIPYAKTALSPVHPVFGASGNVFYPYNIGNFFGTRLNCVTEVSAGIHVDNLKNCLITLEH